MGLYLDSGYLNIDYVLHDNAVFHFIIGGRGTGKTYGALKYAYNSGIKFMYMRRTQNQLEDISVPAMSPFKVLNEDLGWNIQPKKIGKHHVGFYEAVDTEDGPQLGGSPIGYACALSTVRALRSVDLSDVDLLIYDEFIPQKDERAIKNEDQAFFNAYETIDRNRQLQGRPALQVLCLANSNNLANPIFMALELITPMTKMLQKGIQTYYDQSRALKVYSLTDSPISKKKAETALYKLTARDSDFNQMALDNVFAGEDMSKVKSMRLVEYKPVVKIGEITIWRHKSAQRYYVNQKQAGSIPTYSAGSIDLAKFKKSYARIIGAYFGDRVDFEEYLDQVLFESYMNLR